jgi:hypothetical protein
MAALARQLSMFPDGPAARAGANPLRRQPLPPRGSVQEWPLRSGASLGERRFTAWRGRSGRRYVASAFPAHDEHALSFTDAVLLAVTKDRRIIAARDSGPFGIEAALGRWRDSVVAAGACEIHVHLLAEDGLSRRSALLDLMPSTAGRAD